MDSRSIAHGADRKRARRAGASFVALALVFALGACGSDDGDTAATTAGGASTASTVSEQDATIAALNAEVAAQTKRADEAEAKLAELGAQFPITVTASLKGYDLVGAYTLSSTEAYCAGLPTCGAKRPDVRADIIQGANGLELKIPNVLTAGLFDVNGSLFAVTDSDRILDPCGTTPRNARVSITIFADGIKIQADGTRSLTGLGASLLISGDAVGDCPAGVVFFAATLKPA